MKGQDDQTREESGTFSSSTTDDHLQASEKDIARHDHQRSTEGPRGSHGQSAKGRFTHHSRPQSQTEKAQQTHKIARRHLCQSEDEKRGTVSTGACHRFAPEIGGPCTETLSIMSEVQKMVLVPYEKYLRGNLGTIPTDDVKKSGEPSKHDDIQVGNGLSMDLVLTAIPRQYQRKVKAILLHIVDDPRRTLGWNDRGELQYRGDTIPDSHVVDLLKDSQYEYKGSTPRGISEFYGGLREMNIPKSLIGNEKRRRELLEDHLPPGIPAKVDKKKVTRSTNKKTKWVTL
jgi:hypothetical protein